MLILASRRLWPGAIPTAHAGPSAPYSRYSTLNGEPGTTCLRGQRSPLATASQNAVGSLLATRHARSSSRSAGGGACGLALQRPARPWVPAPPPGTAVRVTPPALAVGRELVVGWELAVEAPARPGGAVAGTHSSRAGPGPPPAARWRRSAGSRDRRSQREEGPR